MVTPSRIKTARRAIRVSLRRKKTSTGATVSGAHSVGLLGPSLVDHVKASEHLITTIGAPEHGREKHRPKDLLRMVARFLLDSGRGYPQAEVLEVLLCFTGCSPGAAMEALQVMVAHGIVTAVNEVIRVTW